MKRMFMVVTLIAATTTPALACHHFRVWHYRWPQRCPVALDDHRGSVRPIRLANTPTPPRPEPESPPALAPVQPDAGPPLTKEEEQAVSVEQLRKALERAKPATSGPPSEQAAKPPEAGASGATPAPAASTPSSGSAPTPQASPSAAPAPSATAAPAPASGSTSPGPSAPTVAQAKSSSTPQPAPAGPPSAEKGSDKPKVNDVPVNPLD
jgi:hypothetical protein